MESGGNLYTGGSPFEVRPGTDFSCFGYDRSLLGPYQLIISYRPVVPQYTVWVK